MITGVQEENGSRQEGLLEGLGCIQSESCIEGIQFTIFLSNPMCTT